MTEKNTAYLDPAGPQLADFMPGAKDGFIARAGRPCQQARQRHLRVPLSMR